MGPNGLEGGIVDGDYGHAKKGVVPLPVPLELRRPHWHKPCLQGSKVMKKKVDVGDVEWDQKILLQ